MVSTLNRIIVTLVFGVGLSESHSVLANVSISANASFMTHYLQAHPLHIKTIKESQNDVMTTLNQLQNPSQQNLLTDVVHHQPQQAVVPAMYPVHSEQLTPGRVEARSIHVALPQPMFIVGDDTVSKAWLNRYQHRLTQLHAKGFVVNIASEVNMERLRQRFPSLSLIPLPGGAFATWLVLKHYPVLISDQRIEQ